MEVIMLMVMLNLLFYIFSMKKVKNDEMMKSSYECGFDPFMGSRVGFSYRFFLISILFLVFDVEVVLMLPFPFISVGVSELLGVLYFMVVLLVGLIYEYYNGVFLWL